MNTTIKNYWYTLKKEYEEKYKEKIFTDYETSKPFVEKFQIYLMELLKKYSSNVDIVCALATTFQELRNEQKGIQLLEDFIKAYENELTNEEKARIYTNLAFYNEGCKKELEYLQKAEKLNSPFIETYKGLGLTYFSKYSFDKNTENLEKSLLAFEKALKLDNIYEMMFGYAVCLFELKEYQKAKLIFEDLLIKYPNRMRLMLSISYCEVYLGNKEKALTYLKQVTDGQDENYNLSTDDISDYQIYDTYYMLEDYESFLKEYDTVIADNFSPEIAYYYYALWITKRYQKLDEEIEKQKNKILFWIEETKVDEDFEDEEERIGYIKSYQEDLDKLTYMERKIKNENYKPIGKLELYPEFGCYLVDCIRHSF